MWRDAQDTELVGPVKNAKISYGMVNTSADSIVTAMPDDEFKEQNYIAKQALREEIAAIAALKRADRRMYGNLQISLKFSYLIGKNNYPDTMPDVLRVLNN